MTELTQKDIGYRISELRKSKGYSQEELANLTELSRTIITQIELGNRKLNVLELRKISNFLTISIDTLLSDNYTLNSFLEDKIEEDINISERISIPKLQIPKFKNILLYILEKCAGKSNIGETLLYKLLYFSDFNYYELYEEHLSGATYKKLPFGPVPQKLDKVIAKMIQDKQLQRVKTLYHNYTQTRYLPLEKPDLSTFSAREKSVIDKVINQYSDWSASAISDYSHKDIPWLASDEGEIIDYELAFYREPPFSVRNYD
ncbi:MAG: type II toxin-antitoxin system antitoxin SocA domain-containing protein [Chitinophagales bacterium]